MYVSNGLTANQRIVRTSVTDRCSNGHIWNVHKINNKTTNHHSCHNWRTTTTLRPVPIVACSPFQQALIIYPFSLLEVQVPSSSQPTDQVNTKPSPSQRHQAFIRFSFVRSCDPFVFRKYSIDSDGVSRASIIFIEKSRQRSLFLLIVAHSERLQPTK